MENLAVTPRRERDTGSYVNRIHHDATKSIRDPKSTETLYVDKLHELD
jgi:hypothetical protein